MSLSHILCRFLSVFVCIKMQSCFPCGFGWYHFTLGVIMPTVYMAGDALVVARSQLQYVCLKERMVSSICQLLWIWRPLLAMWAFSFFFPFLTVKGKEIESGQGPLTHMKHPPRPHLTCQSDFQISHVAAPWLFTEKIRWFPGIICVFSAEAISHFENCRGWNVETCGVEMTPLTGMLTEAVLTEPWMYSCLYCDSYRYRVSTPTNDLK